MIIGYLFEKKLLSSCMDETAYQTFFNFCRFLSVKKQKAPEEYDKWFGAISNCSDGGKLIKEFEKIYIDEAILPSGEPQQFAITEQREDILEYKKIIEGMYKDVIPQQIKDLTVSHKNKVGG